MNCIEKFQNAKILVVGDIMVDHYVYGRSSDKRGENGVPIFRIDREEDRFGGAANVAHNIWTLGGTPYLVGIVGNDENGTCFDYSFSKIGMPYEGIVISKHRSTTVKTRFVERQKQLFRIDCETDNKISSSVANSICGNIFRTLKHNDIKIAVVSDYQKGVVNEKVMNSLKEFSNRFGFKIIVDPKFDMSLYENVHLITPNLNEACVFTDDRTTTWSHVGIEELGTKIIRRFNVNCLITRGKFGMSLFQHEHDPIHIEGLPVENPSIVGAGDTVVATMALATAAGMDLYQSSILANRAAAVSCGKFGTSFVTPDEIMK